MVSFRFPFSSLQPPNPPNRPPNAVSSSPFLLAVASAVAAGAGMGLAVTLKLATDQSPEHQMPWKHASPIWASISFSDGPAGTSVEPKTGTAFPSIVDGSRRLMGIGLRKTNVLGLKSIDVYSFGVYADYSDIKKLSNKYGKLSASELKESKEFIADVLDQDLQITVKLQIVYGKLSIRSVRSAFEKTVGRRLEKYSGSDNRELLERFTSIFKDEYKLPRGSVIDLSREQGYVLQTKINGDVVGQIKSKLLCQSVLDLYIGEDPFDRRAKEDIQCGLASIFHDGAIE